MSELITSDELLQRLKTIIKIDDHGDIVDMEIILSPKSHAVIRATRIACNTDDLCETSSSDIGELVNEKLVLVTEKQFAKFQTLKADLIIANKKLDELTKEKPEYSPLLGINPNNTHQARVFFDMFLANEAGENRHPVTVVEELSKTLGFKILNRVPQSLFDGWDFWIEFDKPPKLPDYFRAGIKWKRIGEA